MRQIKVTDKILNISHGDLDGCVSSIVLGNVFPNIYYIYSSFGKVDDYIKNTNYSAWDHIFITDIYPNDDTCLNLSNKFILIDHHDTSIQVHNPKNMRFVDKGQCASKLTLKWIEAYFNVKLPHLYDLINLTNDYDMWKLTMPESKMLNELYWWYKNNAFRNRFFNGNINFNSQEVAYINQRKEEYEIVYQNLDGVDLCSINGCLIFNCDSFINDVCQDLLEKDGYKIVFFHNKKTKAMSVRHNINGLHVGNLIRSYGFGGGHERSAGIQCGDDKRKIADIIGVISNDIYKNFPEARKS